MRIHFILIIIHDFIKANPNFLFIIIEILSKFYNFKIHNNNINNFK